MVMPDAIKALLELEKADQRNLSKLVYNVTSFNPSALEFYDIVIKAFPNAEITFSPDIARQGIVDTWPADVDDSAATTDWGWHPDFGQERAFQEYLLPAVKERYV
jgi:nucleoside-diphosphate-sugar epimerase